MILVLLAAFFIGDRIPDPQASSFASAPHASMTHSGANSVKPWKEHSEAGLNGTGTKNVPTKNTEERTDLESVEEGVSTKIVTSQESISSDKPSALALPRVVELLCANQGDQELIAINGHSHTFHRKAKSAQRCDDSAVWKVDENGAEVTDAATFYFDDAGVLLDICQALFWTSGCSTFEHIICEQTNYCESR